uniref:(California timema) hypothetical protein n=1 Tax=Timema californicum TaxID=61474 RepID=A0A7R9J0R1_TIMCA|nr:unnamed protein product [Timema californicum]
MLDSSDEDAPRRRASRRNRSLVVGITTRSKRPRRTEDGFSSTDDLETMPLNKRQSSANHRSRGRSQSLKAVGNPVQPATKEGSVTIDDTDADMLPFKHLFLLPAHLLVLYAILFSNYLYSTHHPKVSFYGNLISGNTASLLLFKLLSPSFYLFLKKRIKQNRFKCEKSLVKYDSHIR